MSTEEEREVRATLQHVTSSRHGIRFREYAAVGLALLFLVLGFTEPAPRLVGPLHFYVAAALLVMAACSNRYARVMITPQIERLQTRLNRLIG